MDKKIKQLVQEIKKLELEEAKQEGTRNQLLKDLKIKFDIETLETAVEVLDGLRGEMKQKSDELNVKIEKLEKMVQEVKNEFS